MTNIVVQENGKIRRVEDIELAEKIVEARNTKDPWVVIDQMVKLWAARAPEEEKMMQVNVQQHRETQVDQEYGQTKHGQDFERRFVIAFPQSLMLLIRTQYKAAELQMDSKFYKEFAKRYPAFKVAQKV